MSAATPFTPLASLAGGVLIGLSAVVLMAMCGRVAGICGLIRRTILPSAGSAPLESAAFIAGLFATPLLWPHVSGEAVMQTVSPNLALMAVAGLLVGFGAAWANGCTSGHGVCGLSRFSARSIAATAAFMTVAVLTVAVTRHVLGA